MKKTLILCLDRDRVGALEELRSLGLLHVESVVKPESADLTELRRNAHQLTTVINILRERKIDASAADPDPEEAADHAVQAVAESESLKKRLEELLRNRERLEPWGEFSRETIADLEGKGLFVYPCVCHGAEEVEKLNELGVVEIIREDKQSTHLALISREPIEATELPLAPMPSEKKSLGEVDGLIAETRKNIAENAKELDAAAANLRALTHKLALLEEEVEFVDNREGMGLEGDICYIRGYIPIDGVDKMEAAAKRHGWAVATSDPEADDNVPTCVRVPKIFNISKPIFDFIGIAPGYKEWDVSTCFLFFFTIFYGMIVGDAGYGTLFLITGLILKWKFKRSPKARLAINLFIVLSLATIAWGAATCTWFGLPKDKFPEWMRGVPALSGEKSNQYVQLICFSLAAIHLGFARVWKAVIYRDKRAFGQIGWGMLVWANLFTATKLIVFPESKFPDFVYILYGVGILLILMFYVRWNDIGSVFNLPFGLIGTFTDLLSYIRLFAVGLATFYIANSFNNMGLMLMDVSPWLLPGTVIVILFGHILNIALAFMAVLVHGIRLNTLEFSNHMELEWQGHAYAPFKKTVGENSIDNIKEPQVLNQRS